MPKRSIGKVLVFLLFVISRLPLVTSHQRASTLADVNIRYGAEAQRAQQRGVSFYQLHDETRRLQDPALPPAERAVEYPPLAILWMKLTMLFMPAAPPAGPLPDTYVHSAILANQIAMFLVDLCGFATLALAGATVAQLGVYTAGGFLLFPLLYDRFDLVLGVLLLFAVLLLVRTRAAWAPLAVLALAINFKVTPLVLVPLFVLGTLPANALSPVKVRTWLAIGRRLVVLGLFGIALFLPFLLLQGFGTLGFLSYHAKRGLEIASVWNTLPVALGAAIQFPVTASLRFGAVELQSVFSGPFRILSSICTAAVIPALAFAVWQLLARRAAPGTTSSVTLAQANPQLFIRCAALCLLTAIIPAPVLSPQYLLWLVPLAALWDGKSRWWAWGAFLAICALTTVHFPFFTGNVLGVLSVDNGLSLPARLFWTAPLVIRNLLLIAFTAWFWIDSARQPREI